MEKKTYAKIVLLVFSILGLVTSMYLYSLHTALQSGSAICDINSKFSCTNLAQSGYSSFFGIEIAAIGLIGYSLLTILSLLILMPPLQNYLPKRMNEKRLLQIFLALIAISVLFTIYLIAIEFMIQIFCVGCMVSWTCTLVLAATSYYLYHKL